VDLSDEGARQGFLAVGLPEWVADNLVVLFSLLRKGAAERMTDTVCGVTGRAPRSFAQFARDHAPLFRAAPLAV
jgi:hypothetical protein